MKKIILTLVICLVFTTLALPAFAFDWRGEDNPTIAADEIIEDDIFLFGDTITIDGEVKGKVFAMGNMVKMDGKVEDLISFASQVDIDGEVTGDAIIGAMAVNINGSIGDNIVVGSSNFNLNDEATIGRDLYMGAAQAMLDGEVKRNLNAGTGRMNLAGKVDGNMFSQSSNTSFGSDAKVGGNFSYDEKDQISTPTGKIISDFVDGKVATTNFSLIKHDQRNNYIPSIFEFIYKLGGVLIGLIVVWLFPKKAKEIMMTKNMFNWMNMLIGIVVIFVMPFLALMILLTLIGIPISLLLLALYPIFIYLGKIAAGVWLGGRILNSKKGSENSPFYALLIGMAILIVASFIPAFGWLAPFVFTVFGIGLVFKIIYKKTKAKNQNVKA
ncbi:MAG: hypothetical protein ABIE68_02320 [bacterium]